MMFVMSRPLAGGFTLIELLVVLAIAALLVGLAGPMYSAVMPGVRLQSQARDLALSLREGANRAITGGREVSVRFSPDHASYEVSGERPVKLSSGIQLEFENPPVEDEFVLRFFSDGSSSGANIELHDDFTTYRIGVDWLTSRVRVMEADHEAR